MPIELYLNLMRYIGYFVTDLCSWPIFTARTLNVKASNALLGGIIKWQCQMIYC